MNDGKFSVDVAKWAEKTGLDVEQAVKGTAFSLFRDVIFDTPVDEGRLRANWFCTKRGPSSKKVENEEGIYRTDGEIVGSVESVIFGGSKSSSYYLTNNMPYAYRIEFEGHSRIKAPNGMVRKNVVRFNQILENEVKKAK